MTVIKMTREFAKDFRAMKEKHESFATAFQEVMWEASYSAVDLDNFAAAWFGEMEEIPEKLYTVWLNKTNYIFEPIGGWVDADEINNLEICLLTQGEISARRDDFFVGNQFNPLLVKKLYTKGEK